MRPRPGPRSHLFLARLTGDRGDVHTSPPVYREAIQLVQIPVGPHYWNIDLAVSRLVTLGATQRFELRLEAFTLLNHFNWGDPQANFLILNSGTFGRITTQAGAPLGGPRIIQFGVKYDF